MLQFMTIAIGQLHKQRKRERESFAQTILSYAGHFIANIRCVRGYHIVVDSVIELTLFVNIYMYM